jgi:diguanylate cyclase (GGDEF)-like protein
MTKLFIGLLDAVALITVGYFASYRPFWVTILLLIVTISLHMRLFNMFAWKKEATICSLTGCYNRRSFDMALEEIMGKPHSMIVMDIDNFKYINDTFGHRTGDSILKRVGMVLSDHVREPVYRYGGEEFVVILPDTSLKDAIKVAERLICAVSFHVILEGQSITVSAGVSSGDNSVRVFKQADEALLKAKVRGKNRVISYQEIG